VETASYSVETSLGYNPDWLPVFIRVNPDPTVNVGAELRRATAPIMKSWAFEVLMETLADVPDEESIA
jgi:hypothetical protein